MRQRLVLGLTCLALVYSAGVSAQVRMEIPGTSGQINISFTEPGDEGQADRLRELAAQVKPVADQLQPLEQVDIVVVHTPRELEQRLGPSAAGALSGISYVHGILFLTPTAWQRNPTDEAVEQEMSVALVRYTATQLAGGNRLPDWLTEGLVGFLTRRPFAPVSAEPVARRAPLLLAQFEAEDLAVGYWAVRYLVEARGGLASLRQLLRLMAQRPDSFVENLQLVYGVPAGELERDWRRWLERLVEEDRKLREGGVRQGPLIKERP